MPREVAEALGLEPLGTRRVRLPDGHLDDWSIAPVLVRVEGRDSPSLALIGPPGCLALLGAVTLEELSLGVDPSAKRLIPTIALLVSPMVE